MKAYMGFDREGGSECGACLIFAANSREARKLAWPILDSWFDDAQWIHCAVRWLRELPKHLKKSDTGKPRVIESPPLCPRCEMWGGELKNGMCSLCEDEA